MTSQVPPVLLLLISVSLAQATLIVNGDFESFTAGSPPPGGSGYSVNTSGPISSISSVITNNPSLVIAGNQSWLVTFDGAASVFDNETAFYYTAVDSSPFANLSPGTYQVTAKVRVLDPGFSLNFNFFYLSFDSGWAETNNFSFSSSSYTDSDGLVTWTSSPFTVAPNNVNWYSGLQVQITTGPSAITGAQFVLDDFSVIPEPSTTSLLILVGLAGIGRILLRKKAR